MVFVGLRSPRDLSLRLDERGIIFLVFFFFRGGAVVNIPCGETVVLARLLLFSRGDAMGFCCWVFSVGFFCWVSSVCDTRSCFFGIVLCISIPCVQRWSISLFVFIAGDSPWFKHVCVSLFRL